MRKLQRRQRNDLSRSVTALDMDTTLIAVVEMSLSNWLVAGIVPDVERETLKKLKPDESALLDLLNRWRREAENGTQNLAHHCPSRPAAAASGWLAGSGDAAREDRVLLPICPAQVIDELIQLAKDMREANARGEKLGLSEDELAFYDALETNNSAVQGG